MVVIQFSWCERVWRRYAALEIVLYSAQRLPDVLDVVKLAGHLLTLLNACQVYLTSWGFLDACQICWTVCLTL